MSETIAIIGLVLLMIVREVLSHKERIMLEKIRKVNSISELVELPRTVEQEKEEELVDIADMPDLGADKEG